MGRAIRERIVRELARKYSGLDYCVFVDFSGLNVEAMGELRSRCRQKDIDFSVTKNSLLRLAFAEMGLPTRSVTVDEIYRYPTAIVTGGGDVLAVCKQVVEWHKKTNTTRIKGGMLDGMLLTREEVVVLAALPPREVMLAQVLGLFISPLTDIATLINSTLAQVANLLHNHIEKLEGGKTQG